MVQCGAINCHLVTVNGSALYTIASIGPYRRSVEGNGSLKQSRLSLQQLPDMHGNQADVIVEYLG